MLAPIVLGTGSFTRYAPFGDARQIIVRRGRDVGRRREPELSRRQVEVGGRPAWLVRVRQLLSPPAANPRIKPLSPEALRAYSPESEVLYLPGIEVSIPREPAGFSDDEVTMILGALQLDTA
jgi:hypothetical protein